MLVFQCCKATGALECMFWEILQKLAELHSSADVPQNGILYLKMVYCKLDVLVKMVSCKVMTIENETVYCKLDILMKTVSCKGTTIENQHG